MLFECSHSSDIVSATTANLSYSQLSEAGGLLNVYCPTSTYIIELLRSCSQTDMQIVRIHMLTDYWDESLWYIFVNVFHYFQYKAIAAPAVAQPQQQQLVHATTPTTAHSTEGATSYATFSQQLSHATPTAVTPVKVRNMVVI